MFKLLQQRFRITKERVHSFFGKRTNMTNIIDILGCILIATGVFIYSIPLGFIALGFACFAISFLITKNGELDEPDPSYQ